MVVYRNRICTGEYEGDGEAPESIGNIISIQRKMGHVIGGEDGTKIPGRGDTCSGPGLTGEEPICRAKNSK